RRGAPATPAPIRERASRRRRCAAAPIGLTLIPRCTSVPAAVSRGRCNAVRECVNAANGSLRQALPRVAGIGEAAVSRRAREADLRARLGRGVCDVAASHDDLDQSLWVEFSRSGNAQASPEGDGGVLLWGARAYARGMGATRRGIAS